MTSAYVKYPCDWDGSLRSVCPLNGCCKEDSASYCTKYQRTCNRHSEDVASTGRGVVRASPVPDPKPTPARMRSGDETRSEWKSVQTLQKKTHTKISSLESGRLSTKINTSKKFPLYGIHMHRWLNHLCQCPHVDFEPLHVQSTTLINVPWGSKVKQSQGHLAMVWYGSIVALTLPP